MAASRAVEATAVAFPVALLARWVAGTVALEMAVAAVMAVMVEMAVMVAVMAVQAGGTSNHPRRFGYRHNIVRTTSRSDRQI